MMPRTDDKQRTRYATLDRKTTRLYEINATELQIRCSSGTHVTDWGVWFLKCWLVYRSPRRVDRRYVKCLFLHDVNELLCFKSFNNRDWTIEEVALQFLALQSIYLIYFVQIFLTKDKLDAGVHNEFSIWRVEAPERPEPLLDSLVRLIHYTVVLTRSYAIRRVSILHSNHFAWFIFIDQFLCLWDPANLWRIQWLIRISSIKTFFILLSLSMCLSVIHWNV